MEKYPNAVIYRLKCYTNNTYYIGSAVNLNYRMRVHKCIGNNTNSKSIIAGGNYKEPKILLHYPCNDKKELHEMEQGFIDKYREKYGVSVLNINNAYTSEEVEMIKAKLRRIKWNEENPEKVKEIEKRRNKTINCGCGLHYTKRNSARHFKTKTHQKFIQSQNQIQKQVCESLSVLV